MQVYVILNAVNGHRYVGSQTRPGSRWRYHRWLLRRGEHHSPHFQHAFDKYGEAAFSCSIVEDGIDSNEMLLAREQHYIDTWKPEYNVALIAGNRAGVKWPPEQTRRMSELVRQGILDGRYVVPSRLGTTMLEETKEKLRVANTGKVATDETKAKMSLALTGLPKSPEWKQNMSGLKKQQFAEGGVAALGIVVRYGRPVSDETKEKLRAARAKQVETPEAKAKRMAAIAASRAAKGWVSGRKPVQGPELPLQPRKGHAMSEETKEKQRRAAVGRVMSPEAGAKMSAAWAAKRVAKPAPEPAAPGMTGKHHSEEAKERMRQGHLGKTLTDEHRQKLSDAHKGQVFSPEHRQHLAEARQRTVARQAAELAEQPLPPPPPPEMLEEQPLPPPPAPEEVEPFHHTPETREKISEIRSAYWAERHAADPTLGQRSHKERVISEETKERMRQRFAGIPLSEEHRAKLKIARQGRVYTEATRLKMAESRRRVAAEQRVKKAAAEAASAGATPQ